MSQSSTLFQQVQAMIPRAVFARLVTEWRGDYKVHFVDCWSHFLCLLWSLCTHRSSLRDVEASIASRQRFLRRFGLMTGRRASVARANAHRPWQVAAGLFSALVQRFAQVHPPHRLPVSAKLYTLDATVVDLCASLFRWARLSADQAGVKLNVVLDHDGRVPVMVDVTSARWHEIRWARTLAVPAGAVLCFDKGFFDLAWFWTLTQRGCWFVTRFKQRTRYRVIKSRRTCGDSGVVADQLIRFNGDKSKRVYPGRLRLIDYVDPQTKRSYRFLTNQVTEDARTICAIYKARWQIELFFKWIKGNLKIKSFFGRSDNAVRWQLYVAFCLYLILAYLKYRLKLTWSLRRIHRLLEQHLFERVALKTLLYGSYQFQT